jgi:endo-1,4-beta-xylanase
MPGTFQQFRVLILFLIASAGTPSVTLRQAADEAHLLVSAAVRPSLFSEAAYSATLGREFNMVEPEDAMKWWTVRREAGSFDFREGDEVVRFAQAHGMKVRGHCLCGTTTIRNGWCKGTSRPRSYLTCCRSTSPPS